MKSFKIFFEGNQNEEEKWVLVIHQTRPDTIQITTQYTPNSLTVISLSGIETDNLYRLMLVQKLTSNTP